MRLSGLVSHRNRRTFRGNGTHGKVPRRILSSLPVVGSNGVSLLSGRMRCRPRPVGGRLDTHPLTGSRCECSPWRLSNRRITPQYAAKSCRQLLRAARATRETGAAVAHRASCPGTVGTPQCCGRTTALGRVAWRCGRTF
jgi:hypothetical protein